MYLLSSLLSARRAHYDVDKFRNDILSNMFSSLGDNVCVNDFVISYHATLRSLLDIHAPVETIVVRPRVPWFSNDIKALFQTPAPASAPSLTSISK